MRIEELVSQDYTLIGSGRWLRSTQHDSLVVDIQKQVFFWNSRGIVGNCFDWLIKVKGLSVQEAKNILGDYNPLLYTAVPEDNTPVIVNEGLVNVFFDHGKRYRDFWYDRGYTDMTIDLFKLGYTGEWYVIPIYVDGIFRNFQCRQAYPKRLKSWYRKVGALPFNLDYFKRRSWGVIVEGPVDAIACMQAGIPAMSTNAGADYFNPRWVAQLANVNPLYIAFDNDEGGRYGIKKVGQMFGNKARCYSFEDFEEGTDPNDFFKGGGKADDFIAILETKSKPYWEV